ncbi:MAG: DnaJ domain-containing protein [Polyangiaceae bacterium]
MPGDDEEVDIDPALRRYVTDACARLDTIDHYTLLEVPRTAKERDIKRAYLRLVGRLHPDRFFRKRLGSYKPGLQRLFTQITTAHDVLTTPELRAEYDEELSRRYPGGAADGVPAGSSSPLPPSPVAPTAAPAHDPGARKAAMDALAARFADAKAQARQLAETAGRARAAGDLVAAAEAYRNALRRTPGDPALTAALAEVERGAAERVAESRRKQALLEERYGHWAEAASSWQRVLDAFPADDDARRHLAGALERARVGR